MASLCVLLIGFGSGSYANDAVPVVRVAVATNFAPVLEELSAHYSTNGSNKIEVISGSTGKLFAQITNGMKVDVFLAADQQRPDRLVEAGLASPESQLTYAYGRLVWWQPDAQPTFNQQSKHAVHSNVKFIALAQPDIAPYGLAARQALANCFQFKTNQVRFVFGENVGQSFAQIATGNADAGLVALANVKKHPTIESSSYALVAKHCHKPIKQDAVLLHTSENVAQATHFLKYLQSESTKALIRQYGYDVP